MNRLFQNVITLKGFPFIFPLIMNRWNGNDFNKINSSFIKSQVIILQLLCRINHVIFQQLLTNHYISLPCSQTTVSGVTLLLSGAFGIVLIFRKSLLSLAISHNKLITKLFNGLLNLTCSWFELKCLNFLCVVFWNMFAMVMTCTFWFKLFCG